MSTEQLALDFTIPAPPRPDHRPPCSTCMAPALARVHGFTPHPDATTAQQRNADRFVTLLSGAACRTHLDAVTAEVRTIVVEASPTAYLLVWSHVYQPGDPTSHLPGTDVTVAGWGWHEVERVTSRV